MTPTPNSITDYLGRITGALERIAKAEERRAVAAERITEYLITKAKRKRQEQQAK